MHYGLGRLGEVDGEEGEEEEEGDEPEPPEGRFSEGSSNGSLIARMGNGKSFCTIFASSEEERPPTLSKGMQNA
jgi:hypothetical protein